MATLPCADLQDRLSTDPGFERALADRGISVWRPPDPATAAALPVLLVRGAMPEAPGVAVVGARASDAYGLAVAARAARDAVLLGRAVVSGGAEGCDAAAHRAALDAGGSTVVVLGSGHDHVYPACHRDLFADVVRRGGAVVSPFLPEVGPARFRFLVRNEVIAALAAAVVVARAAARSGALSTAKAARALGRAVLAVPGAVGEGLGEGGNGLLARGHATALTGPGDLARALGLDPGERLPGGAGGVWPAIWAGAPDPFATGLETEVDDDSSGPSETPEASAITRALAQGTALDLDTLVVHTGLDVAAVIAALTDLQVTGLIDALPGQRYSLRRRPAAGRGSDER